MEYLLFLKRPIDVDDLWSAVNSLIYRNVNTILGENICNESNERFENYRFESGNVRSFCICFDNNYYV